MRKDGDVDLETFRWLLTDEGQRLLLLATDAYVDAGGDPVVSATAVRRLEPDPDRAAAALTQVQLRARAVAKFSDDAVRMYFTPDALEQATRPRVADHRAARLVAAEVGSVLDLGCGIGGDLAAFARAGLTAAGLDLDPVRAAIAEANLAALGLPGAVTVADATEVDPAGFGAVFADPARRSARGRVFDVHGWTPAWDFVRRLPEGRAGSATTSPASTRLHPWPDPLRTTRPAGIPRQATSPIAPPWCSPTSRPSPWRPSASPTARWRVVPRCASAPTSTTRRCSDCSARSMGGGFSTSGAAPVRLRLPWPGRGPG